MCFTMGNIEEGKSSTSDKSSPAPPDQTNIHVYPDGAAMQAYYGPRVALPPYYNSAVASGHAPHPYIWGLPQPMMPPYGAPYATVYSHGVYAHPAVPIVSHPHGPGIVSSPAAGTLSSAETPTKSSGNTDRGLVNKLKGFDGLAMSIGNGNAETVEGGGRLSQSVETEVSSDGIDGNTTRGKKRSREGTPTVATGGDAKMESHSSPLPREVNASTDNVLRAAVAPGMTTALELRNPPSVNAAKTSPTTIPQSGVVLPSEAWLQNELELKREKRKQSNRESARRSRLRKQAEAEELAHKVEVLTTENMALQSEISQFTEKSEKLRLENAALTEKLKNAQLGHAQEMILNIDEHRAPAVSTENFLSRVNNSAFEEESDLYERNSNSGAKLHQLLDASPRADAVAAG